MKILSLNSRGVSTDTKRHWIKELRTCNRVQFLGLQETYLKEAEFNLLKSMWGNWNFDFELLEANGRSGGVLSLWDRSCFVKTGSLKGPGFLAVWGNWIGSPIPCGFINVYAPQALSDKRALWNNLSSLMVDYGEVLWITFGDFNEVRSADERKGTDFSFLGARVFNDFIHNSGLIEIKSGGRKFSRISKDGGKLSLLDRFFVSTNYLSKWPNPSAIILPCVHSDHCPVLFNACNLDFGPSYFKFFNSWILDPHLASIVSLSWGSSHFPFHISPMGFFMNKLKALKKDIRLWRLEVNKKQNGSLETLKESLFDIDRRAEISPISSPDSRLRQDVLIKIKELEHVKILDLKQKARVRWAVDGDENSKFFHGLINHNRRTNFIHGLSSNGMWVADPLEIKKIAFDYFAAKFANPPSVRPSFVSPHFKKLDSEQSSLLERPITMDELKSAVLDCGSDKAPGPDGFTLAFYKSHWLTIKDDLFRAVKFFEVTGSFDRGCNASFIALIPKKQSPLSLQDYRPISLLNSFYKVISKILANRLKDFIGDVIGSEQTAYIKNKSILDGPLIVSEIISWIKNSNRSALVFKIDFEKAFDTVNWAFLDEVMMQMNFGHKWRSWIQSCLKSASVSVLINGSATPEFSMGKGVRQGDPLAPLLFIIAAEALNIMMHEACNKGVFHGINLPNSGPIVSHLQFADDVLFMGEWSMINVVNLLRLLRCFQMSSGLKVNTCKSNIIGVGVDSQVVETFAARVHCRAGNLPLTYLGLPIGLSMNKSKSWAALINKFEAKLSLWKSNTLSFGGRLVLVKSVLGSLGTYFLSLFKAPMKVIKSLESIRSKFFWGNKNGKRKISWLSWDAVLSEKSKGGLGIGSIKGQNVALLAKWWWRFKKERNALWRKVICSLHGINGGLDQLNSVGKFAGLWRNIIKVQRDYEKVNLPLSSWFQITPEPNSNFPSVTWALNNEGVFSVSSARIAYDDFSLNAYHVAGFNHSSWIPSKVNILAWRIYHRRLPTKINLFKRGVNGVSPWCVLCNEGMEDEEHLFVSCNFSKLVLQEMGRWWGVDTSQINSIEELFRWGSNKNLNKRQQKAITGVVYSYCWLI
ncbi:hypothetical protein OSB04_002527 [Centaurea solstitialis]|uniref:Reverse transcriptase domain-containing protein n=1 Tax=Centaurea solstitialis TaxID=347529 RepID=A0AA38U3N1_9ASTR|nr:hypothetical protein OSB04_002527 [Centaurea solstitialis]